MTPRAEHTVVLYDRDFASAHILTPEGSVCSGGDAIGPLVRHSAAAGES